MKTKSTVKTCVVLFIVLILLIMSLFPFVYMMIQSIMPWDSVDKILATTKPTLRSYQYLFNIGGSANGLMWVKALLNSVIVSLPTAIISVILGLFTGYSATKLKFSGKKLIYNSLLFQMFFPTIILLIPRYIMMKPFANTYVGMIMPLCVSTWAIFMYINYFSTLPNEVFEAARIDGLGDFRMITKIAFPLTKSVTTIVFLSVFMTRWNELMWDMLISPKIQMQTLNVLISTQFKPMGNLPGPMYAASVLLTLPIVILFLCFSKYFKEGINFMLK